MAIVLRSPTTSSEQLALQGKKPSSSFPWGVVGKPVLIKQTSLLHRKLALLTDFHEHMGRLLRGAQTTQKATLPGDTEEILIGILIVLGHLEAQQRHLLEGILWFMFSWKSERRLGRKNLIVSLGGNIYDT